MIRFILLLAICQGIWAQGYFFRAKSYGANQMVQQIRNLTTSWTPTDEPVPEEYQFGLILDRLKENRLPMGVSATLDEAELPESFDAREQWPMCESLRQVRNQGCCGSCWAVSAASVMTDRWCIHSKGKNRFNFGSYDLVACCYECGYGCDGGDLAPTWQYWVDSGISSGGEFKSGNGCHPYPFGRCVSADQEMPATPKCLKKCQSAYNVSQTSQDRRYGRIAYSVQNDETAIMSEIYLNGPVQAAFRVFEDFKHYKSGVYRHVTGKQVGGHAIKIIGWGVENGVKYWLCANSWGNQFGLNGHFKFVRGENHLGIESDIYAGIPSYKKVPGMPTKFNKEGFYAY